MYFKKFSKSNDRSTYTINYNKMNVYANLNLSVQLCGEVVMKVSFHSAGFVCKWLPLVVIVQAGEAGALSVMRGEVVGGVLGRDKNYNKQRVPR